MEIKVRIPTKMNGDSHVVLHLEENMMPLDQVRHIKVDCHFIRVKVEASVIFSIMYDLGKLANTKVYDAQNQISIWIEA